MATALGTAISPTLGAAELRCGRAGGSSDLSSDFCCERWRGRRSTARPLAMPPARKVAQRQQQCGARAAAAAATAVAVDARPVPRLKKLYTEKVVPALKEEFNYSNAMEIPYLQKIVVNCGVGEAAQNAKSLESSVRDVSVVTGQKPVTTRAKKAIAGFKLREGVPVGVCLTLRGEIMYSFLDRLMNLALPRTRDFQGVNLYSFDGKGNYTLGLPEQSVFPEIRFENIDKERGMDINIVSSAKTDNEGQKLLALLGMPFKDSATGRIANLTRKKKGGAWKGGKLQKSSKPPKPQAKKKKK